MASIFDQAYGPFLPQSNLSQPDIYSLTRSMLGREPNAGEANQSTTRSNYLQYLSGQQAPTQTAYNQFLSGLGYDPTQMSQQRAGLFGEIGMSPTAFSLPPSTQNYAAFEQALAPNAIPSSEPPGPITSGSVAGASTGPTSGTAPQAQQPQGQQPQQPQVQAAPAPAPTPPAPTPPAELTPAAPSEEAQMKGYDFNELVAPAINALNEFQGVLQQGQTQQLREVEGSLGRNLRTISEGQQETISTLERQRLEAKQNAGLAEKQLRESEGRGVSEQEKMKLRMVADQERQRERAITEQQRQMQEGIGQQRRIFDEVSRGLQARFGGTTGTGQFANEILGRDVARNISQQREGVARNISNIQETAGSNIGNIRETIATNMANIRGEALAAIGQNQQALEQTLGRIREAMTNVNREATRLKDQAAAEAEDLKERIRQNLRESLAQINIQKGELEMRKGEMRLAALQDAKNRIAQIEDANRAFQQQLFRDAQQQQFSLDAMKAQAEQEFQLALKTSALPARTAAPRVEPINVQLQNMMESYADRVTGAGEPGKMTREQFANLAIRNIPGLSLDDALWNTQQFWPETIEQNEGDFFQLD